MIFGVYGILLIVAAALQLGGVGDSSSSSNNALAETMWALGAIPASAAILLGLGMFAMASVVASRFSRSTRVAATAAPLLPAVLGLAMPFLSVVYVSLAAVFSLLILIALWCSPATDAWLHRQQF